MSGLFRAHHILCTSLYEGRGYSNAFCDNMTAIVERLRGNPDEPLQLAAEPDMICAGCPNRTADGKCSENFNRAADKDKRVIERFHLTERERYTYRELCRHAKEFLTPAVFLEFCGNCSWREQGLCKYEDLQMRLAQVCEAGAQNGKANMK